MSTTIDSLREITRQRLDEQKQIISYNLVATGIIKGRLQEKEDNIAFFEIADKISKLDSRKNNKDVKVKNWWDD